jgi:hypothetical protein
LSPAAAAELAAAADAVEDAVEDAVLEPDCMPELVIIDVSIIVDDIMSDDIISLDIIVSDIISVSDIIMVSDIVESDSIVSVMSAGEDVIDIVTVEEALVVVMDWAAARALRVQTITVMKRILDFGLNECSVIRSELN